MPPYNNSTNSDDDNDYYYYHHYDSEYSEQPPLSDKVAETRVNDATTPPPTEQRRSVRFAMHQNQIHAYPGVPDDCTHLVWYTAEEEAAFLQRATLVRQAKAEPKVLSHALLLGSLMIHGAILRAVLLGHAIAAKM